MTTISGLQTQAKPVESATAILREEHNLALQVLRVLDRAVDLMEDGQEISPFFFEEVLDFLQLYVDCAHHAKEEEILFPYLKAKGIQAGTVPVDSIHQDHDEERRLVEQMSRGLNLLLVNDPAGRPMLLAAAGKYTHIARRHIMKENTLFMRADALLPPEAQAELGAAFELLERQRLHEGTPARLKELVNELQRQAFHW
jgi:branched-chain amino acid transport system ATP-binding protein